MDCWGVGVKLILEKVNLDPRPAIRWPGTGGAVSVDKHAASKISCRSGCRPATLLLSVLSSLLQQFPEGERRPWRFRSKK